MQTNEITISAAREEGQNIIRCPKCDGQGHWLDQHLWSDGWGMVECICPACNGTGSLDALAIVNEALSGRVAEGKLAHLRTNCALFFACADNIPVERTYPKTPLILDPSTLGLKLAPRPSPWQSTWTNYLKEAAELAPRI